jgi:hypothetical protein
LFVLQKSCKRFAALPRQVVPELNPSPSTIDRRGWKHICSSRDAPMLFVIAARRVAYGSELASRLACTGYLNERISVCCGLKTDTDDGFR